ncbi:MAG: hypothetical protein AAGG02_12230 [Cyanobacteria bacterium P01_H01_bin.15]
MVDKNEESLLEIIYNNRCEIKAFLAKNGFSLVSAYLSYRSNQAMIARLENIANLIVSAKAEILDSMFMIREDELAGRLDAQLTQFDSFSKMGRDQLVLFQHDGNSLFGEIARIANSEEYPVSTSITMLRYLNLLAPIQAAANHAVGLNNSYFESTWQINAKFLRFPNHGGIGIKMLLKNHLHPFCFDIAMSKIGRSVSWKDSKGKYYSELPEDENGRIIGGPYTQISHSWLIGSDPENEDDCALKPKYGDTQSTVRYLHKFVSYDPRYQEILYYQTMLRKPYTLPLFNNEMYFVRSRNHHYLSAINGFGAVEGSLEGGKGIYMLPPSENPNPNPSESDQIWWIEKFEGKLPLMSGDHVFLRTRKGYTLGAVGGRGDVYVSPDRNISDTYSDQMFTISKVDGGTGRFMDGRINPGDPVVLTSRTGGWLGATNGVGPVTMRGTGNTSTSSGDECWFVDAI